MYSSTGLHGLRGTVAASALSPDPFSYDSIRNCYFANPTSSAMSSPSHFTCSLPPQSLYASSIPLTPHPPAMFYGDPLCHQLTSPSDLPGGCGSLTGWIGGAMPVRKERSRDAARNRRGKENTEFFELAKTLPVSIAITSQLDKASIVRLTIAFLRMRHLSALCSPPWSNSVSVLPHVKDSNPTTNSCLDFSDSIGMHMLQAMDGFVMALYKDGRILYVSETVSVYLGLSQVELTGNHILEYVHQDDHTELCEAFQLDYEEFQGDITPIAGSPYRTENNINTASNSYGITFKNITIINDPCLKGILYSTTFDLRQRSVLENQMYSVTSKIINK
ncbi:neuronal PAS domain-containing protein 1-like, partial [Symsagittifera roscoffensis]|uniref:neuronal PAS domain-containing protein 1-like n=1 Tax=Symsagittifera roscoffensis TaxID=84072 RepID=UPI00307B984B